MALFNKINPDTIGQLLADADLTATGTFLEKMKLLTGDAYTAYMLKSAQASLQVLFTPTTTLAKLQFAADLTAAASNPTRGMDNYLLSRILALEALAKPVVTQEQ